MGLAGRRGEPAGHEGLHIAATRGRGRHATIVMANSSRGSAAPATMAGQRSEIQQEPMGVVALVSRAVAAGAFGLVLLRDTRA